ncbi:MAG TPA: HEAT repeat domain-containing protein, partial [Phycisphaerales bacterium]|nr:HEAT repeat domain-containing protein [Phycisphaerales bacterium]
NDTGRTDAERAVASVARKITDESRRADIVLNALNTEESLSVKCSLLRVLGGIANSKSLDAVAAASQHADATVRDAAVRTLSQWPNASAAKVLLDIYSDNQNLIHRQLALRGFARMLALPDADRSARESLEMCRKVMSKTRSADEKKQVLSGLGNVAHPDALAMAGQFVEIEAVRTEAAMATIKIAAAIGQTHPDQAKTAIEKVLSVAQIPYLREQAQETLRQIEQAQSHKTQDGK